MSKNKFEESINKELERLNEIIDFKIIHGVGYNSDARKHRRLLIKAARAERRNSSLGFLNQLFMSFKLNFSR